jgi:hypothetical protein
MHTVVRTYSGKSATERMDVLEKNKAEVERLIRAVQGGCELFSSAHRERRLFSLCFPG